MLETRDLWLVMALLLCIWLLFRVRTEPSRRAPAPRHMPITPDELGRVLFEVVREADIEGYRNLFLMGRETAEVFGTAAEAYLARRTPAVIEESLVTIGAMLPEGTHYAGMDIGGDGEARLKARRPDGTIHEVPVGIAVKVGAVWRLREPAEDRREATAR